MTPACARMLADGRRLHLQHGPIDLVVEAFGPAAEIRAAYGQVTAAFEPVLQRLVDELPLLRRPLGQRRPAPYGPVARRMVAAVWPHRRVYVTPMAAVAGAVADAMLAALIDGRRLRRAYVNNGGDIALHLTGNERLKAGLVADLEAPALATTMNISANSGVHGIATSGRAGRSQSLGIADAVTVLAETAAAADAAATLIANAVNVDHPAVKRRPARAVKDDSDLGDLPVTVTVGSLPGEAVTAALERGRREAARMRQQGLIAAACLALQGRLALVQSSSQPMIGALCTNRAA